MLTWVKLAIAILRAIDTFLGIAREKKWISVGYDKAMAEVAASILKKSDHANKVMAEISRLNEDDVDSLLHSLEPKTK